MFNGDYSGEVSGDSGTGIGIEKLLAQTEIGKWSLVLNWFANTMQLCKLLATSFSKQLSPWI